jgi:hypothetical protein
MGSKRADGFRAFFLPIGYVIFQVFDVRGSPSCNSHNYFPIVPVA